MAAIMTRVVALGEMTEEQRRIYQAGRALHRDGASPAGALNLLATIIEERTWERVVDVKGEPFVGRFRDFVADRSSGLGCSPAELIKVIGLRHPHEGDQDTSTRMKVMRTEVERLLREEIEPARKAGRPSKEDGGKERTTLVSETVERHLARLKRDDPALAAEVVNGHVSAYAAARSKGWRPPRIQVTTPERTAIHLRKYMTSHQLARLAHLLLDAEGK
jgi:hypothetical protein